MTLTTHSESPQTADAGSTNFHKLKISTNQKVERADDNNAANADPTTKRCADILLNNFQIKKKRYRVLLNHDHIVWERLNAKEKIETTKEKVNPKKVSEFESEQLSTEAQYGSNSKVVHINEIVSVRKGETKAATLRNETQTTDFTHAAQTPNSTNSANRTSPTAQYLTVHYAERIINSATDCNRFHIRSLTLYNADAYVVAQWHTLLSTKLLEQPNRLHIRRLLVFINPYGGRKAGLQTYERSCKPIFQLAGVDVACVISQRANQIRDIIMSHDLTPYDAVCCVGGDGTAAEVINGLIFRAMRDRGLDMQQPAYIPKPALPIGIIPAGSTDTIAYSVHGTADPCTAAIHVILGQRRGCDVCSVRNPHGIVRFCASVFSYGYLGDVASHSERYRWMGPKRYEFTGVKAFLANRGYDAEIRFLEATYDENCVEPRTSRTTLATESICYANCQRCSSIVSTNNEVAENLATQTTASNWTLQSDDANAKSFEPVTTTHASADEIVSVGDVVDRQLTLEAIASQDVKSCDKNLENNNSTEESQKIECDKITKVADTATLAPPQPARSTVSASQHSFSFCSTNSSATGNKALSETANISLPSPTPTMTSQWKVIRGDFFMISCANITCACARTPNGIARYNHLGDGHLDVILVRKTSIWNNVRFALNTMGRSGDIRNLPFVDVFRTRQLHFRANFPNTQSLESLRGSTQPIADAFQDDVADKLVSSWNCDGEVVHDLDIKITSHCQLIDVFMRGPYSYKNPNNNSQSNFCCCSTSN